MKKKLLLKNYPALKTLISEKAIESLIKSSKTCSELAGDREFCDFLENSKKSFSYFINSIDSENVEYFTKTYRNAVSDSSNCLVDTLSKLGKGDIFKGLSIALGLTQNNSISGVIMSKEDIDKLYYFYSFKLDCLNNLSLTIALIQEEKRRVITSFETARSLTEVVGKRLMNDLSSYEIIMSVILILAFKKLAETEIETYELIDDSRVIDHGISKFQRSYEIENLEPVVEVKYYSANWYKEIICNHEFSVSGHWRNQPTKDGYKIIFIKPFVKHGYHRKASMNLEMEEA